MNSELMRSLKNAFCLADIFRSHSTPSHFHSITQGKECNVHMYLFPGAAVEPCLVDWGRFTLPGMPRGTVESAGSHASCGSLSRRAWLNKATRYAVRKGSDCQKTRISFKLQHVQAPYTQSHTGMPKEAFWFGFRFRWLFGFAEHLQNTGREGGKGSVWLSQTLDKLG